MRWQRVARYGVAAAAVGVGVLLYVSTRPRPTSERPAAGTIADPQVAVQGPLCSQTRFQGEGGDRQFTFNCRFFKELTDGRMILEGFEMKLEDGTAVTAESAETRGRLASEELPAEILLKGKVHMTTPEGAVVDAVEATYQHSVGSLTMPGPVSFVRGRVSGSGVGGSYTRDTGIFVLQTEARVTGAAVENEAPFTATSNSLTFNRASRSLLFDGNAVIDTSASRMTATRSTLYLTDDKEHFRVIELRERAHVAPLGDPAAPGAAPDMRAVDMDLSFHEGTQALERAVLTRDAVMVVMENGGRQSIAATTIVAVTAPDGRTLTELDARERVDVRTPSREGGPERQVTSATLFAKGDPKRGLTSAVFAGGATFIETVPGSRGRAAAERRGTSDTLSLVLGGKLDAIEEAKFQRNVVFRDGDVSGDADLGTYRAAKGQLVLEPASPVRKPPHVTNGDVDVNAAERIDIDLSTRDVYAVGDVRTVMRQNGTAKAGGSSLFDGRESITGSGREFWYTGKTGRVRYVGRNDTLASIRQGERQVDGRTVDADKDGGNLKATGSVQSNLVLDGQNGGRQGSPPSSYRITADSLDYREDARTATYLGAAKVPVVMTATDGTTTSQKLVLTLARESRTLDRLDASGDVYLKLSGSREALSNTLTYEASTQRYVLRGNVKVRWEEEKPSCSTSEAAVATFTQGSRAPEFPDGRGFVVNKSADGRCTGALTR